MTPWLFCYHHLTTCGIESQSSDNDEKKEEYLFPVKGCRDKIEPFLTNEWIECFLRLSTNGVDIY